MSPPTPFPEKRTYLTAGEFRRLGYLQELNRQFLHPLGLALAVDVHADGTESLGKIWDYRTDPEGVRFEGFDLTKRAALIEAEWAARETARIAALGYMVQPTEGDPK